MIDVDCSSITRADFDAMRKVADRTERMDFGFGRDRMTLVMDLEFAHIDCGGMDWDRLLAFDDGDFGHDMAGIAANINRETGKLDNCFLPRCTAH